MAAESVASVYLKMESLSISQSMFYLSWKNVALVVTALLMKKMVEQFTKAGLSLDNYESVMKGNLDNTVVEAGNLIDSYLYEVVTLDEDDDMFMPPKGGPLSTEQIDVLRWIEEGAKATAVGGNTASDMSNGEFP